ncbi:TOBE domain-containing protein [Avibacterium paragallinarum]|uniref:TOBE domain-containing protein n=1 Tax=Avibacterium paragallinarum TaxID=728 RepID=UPI00102A285F|nr:TOBE domain-containing protein [Avibacterium paragallinarum]RZN53521.1 LysR family transcriptional regulator [Avibacterium paragallinarum]TID29325.1 transcriptional regulator [Avibacterium paragallinarum]
MQDSEVLLTIKLQQQLFVDPKRIRLLREIQQCGSINQAAKNAQVSYKSAWDHLEAMNKISPHPLLDRNIGGKNGGGTSLTPYALRLLQLYDLLEQTQQRAFEILQNEDIPLDSLLSATTQFSPQSSARNQFLGSIKSLTPQQYYYDVEVELAQSKLLMHVFITQQSAVRLQLDLGKEVLLMVKAPWVKLVTDVEQYAQNLFNATVDNVINDNQQREIELSLSGEKNGKEKCYASLTSAEQIPSTQSIRCHIDPAQIVLLTLN